MKLGAKQHRHQDLVVLFLNWRSQKSNVDEPPGPPAGSANASLIVPWDPSQ